MPSGKQQTQYHMGTPMGGSGGTSVPADLTPSLDLNALTTRTAPASDTPPAAPIEPAGPPLVAPLVCAGVACGEPIVYIGQDGAAYLRVHERQIPRPHKLQPADLPLVWKCHRCGEPVTITASDATDGDLTIR